MSKPAKAIPPAMFFKDFQDADFNPGFYVNPTLADRLYYMENGYIIAGERMKSVPGKIKLRWPLALTATKNQDGSSRLTFVPITGLLTDIDPDKKGVFVYLTAPAVTFETDLQGVQKDSYYNSVAIAYGLTEEASEKLFTEAQDKAAKELEEMGRLLEEEAKKAAAELDGENEPSIAEPEPASTVADTLEISTDSAQPTA